MNYLITISLLFSLLLPTRSKAQQNLITNPDFEEYYDCDYEYYQDDIKTVIPGWSAIHNSPRYFNNICYNEPTSTYYQIDDYCPAQFGLGYVVGLINPKPEGTPFIREYLQTRLIDTLHQGKPYFISYYLSISPPEQVALSHYGINFSDVFIDEDVTPGLPYEQIYLDPTIEIDTVPNLNYCEWSRFTHCFIPDQNYTVMTVGVFAQNEEILNVENIKSTHTAIAYDNYFLAEIEQELALDTSYQDTICVGDCITLSTNHSLIDGDFIWQLPGSDILSSTDSVVTVCYQSEGVYDVAIDVTHCIGSYSNSFAEAITVIAPPTWTPPSDTIICAGDELLISIPSIYNVTLNGEQVLENNITLEEEGDYIFNISNGYCEDQYYTNISFINTPTFQLAEVYSCKEDITSFLNVQYDTPGIYYDTLQNAVGCDSIYFEINYQYFETSSPLVDGSLSYCPGTQTVIGINTNSTVLWNDGTDYNPKIFDTAGTYSFSFTDSNLCLVSDSITITEYNSPTVVAGDLIDIWYYEGIELPVTYDGEISTYIWNNSDALDCDDCPFPSLVQPIDGLYPVEVINSFGCTDRDTVRVSFIDIEVYIPNVVSTSSPNNNNSTFSIHSNIDIDYSMVIYDRWGNVMYSEENLLSNNPSQGWTPRDVVNPGVFVYLITYNFNGEQVSVSGDVTVL